VKGYAEQAGVNATPHTFRHRAFAANFAGNLPARRRGRTVG
jgi:site-specific recombinase XerD